MADPKPQVSAERLNIMTIRRARRYLNRNEGTLARVLNAYKAASAKGSAMGHLPEQ